MRNIDNMDDNDGSSPDTSPRREPPYNPIPNPPHAQVAAHYDFLLLSNFSRWPFATVHYHGALLIDSLRD
jgi:hypothetical protein